MKIVGAVPHVTPPGTVNAVEMMMTAKTFLISDTHFSHKNICDQVKFGKGARPFASVQEMNDTLIARWNSAVGPADTVYHLGDFSMWKTDKLDIVKELHGTVVLIRGNHDTFPATVYLRAGFADVQATWEFPLVEGDKTALPVLCTHIPVHPMEVDGKPLGRYSYNVHGHIHKHQVIEHLVNAQQQQGYRIDRRYLCVSVEQTDYAPLELSEVRSRLLSRG